jgi:phosphatidylserine decarboxylase
MDPRIVGRLPLAVLSRLVGWAAQRRWPAPLLQPVLRCYAAHYGVALAEAESPLADYATLEAFFTRRLRPGARPVADAALVSPCDGTVRGPVAIHDGALLEAKGCRYRLAELLGPLRDWGARFEGGRCLTLYLSPRDYHRYHSPAAMMVRRVAHIPGRRWPVNPWAIRHVPNLFVDNERVVVVAETEAGWPLAMVFVAALNVGGIHLHGVGLRGHPLAPTVAECGWPLAAGDEMGYFSLGSTILLLLPKDAPTLRPFDVDEVIRVGSAWAPWLPGTPAPPPPVPPPP